MGKFEGEQVARKIRRLSALGVARANTAGMYPDGNGLYLQVTGAGTKSWIYRFMLRGHAREMGLGPLATVSLGEAREKATDCRRLTLAGIDPIEARRKSREIALLEAAKTITFKDAAEAYVDAHRHGWRSAKHADQWTSTLEAFAYPVIGPLPVQDIAVTHVLKIIEPLWSTKTETASRLRGRIESVLDWARARGYCRGENPARWRGHIENLLPARSKVRRVVHHAAMPYREIGAFMKELRQQVGVSPKALEFAVLTATRTSETLGARWTEFDLDQAVWIIPANRIKGGKEHRVPLAAAALVILREMQTLSEGEYVFPGGKRGKPLSSMALLAVLRRMKRGFVTHGFRSTFRTWLSETTNYPREIAEQALAHTVGDAVERAYRRGDMLQRRRALMDDWATYCDKAEPTDNVIELGRARSPAA